MKKKKALKAVSINGMMLKKVKPKNRKYYICLEAVKQNGLALKYVKRQTEYICEAAVKQNAFALKYVDIEFQTENLCLTAIKNSKMPLVLKFVKFQTEELCLAAVKYDELNLKYVKRQTPKICLEVLKRNGMALKYIRKQTPEICSEAVKQNGYALKYVREQTPEICLEAIRQNAFALQFVREQTEEICLEAVKQDGMTLQFVLNQTEEICLEAVKQDGYALQFVREQTEEICEESIKRIQKQLYLQKEETRTFKITSDGVRDACGKFFTHIISYALSRTKDSSIHRIINTETGKETVITKIFMDDPHYVKNVIRDMIKLLNEFTFFKAVFDIRMALEKGEDVRSRLGDEILVITDISLEEIKKFISEEFKIVFCNSDDYYYIEWYGILCENFSKIAVLNNDKYVSFCCVVFVNRERLILEETDEFGIIRDYYNDTKGIVKEDSIKYVIYDK